MATKNPQTVTIYGRLSFPTWEAQAAYERSLKGKFPAKSVAEAKPEFTLLVEPAQLAKFKTHVENEFFPFCAAIPDGKSNSLDPKEIKALLAQINDPAFDGPYNTPFKPVSEKTAEMVPEAVAAVKAIGNAGVDLEQKAIVNTEDELSTVALARGDVLSFPCILPIKDTVHQMYAGCYVAATFNLYAYHNGKNAGFSAGASVAVFKTDGDRLGGGVAVDEDDIFLD